MLAHFLIFKVFDYYKSLGVLEVTMTSLPDSQPNHPVLTNLWMYKHNDPHLQLWRNEPISVNDCILRNIHRFQYIANIDNDEMIIPEKYNDWNEMLEGLGNETAGIKVKQNREGHLIVTPFQSLGAFCFFNAYFLDDMLEKPFEHIPEKLHMMQHVYRSQYSQHAKCLFNTETILTVQQHLIQDCIVSGQCWVSYPDKSVGENEN